MHDVCTYTSCMTYAWRIWNTNKYFYVSQFVLTHLVSFETEKKYVYLLNSKKCEGRKAIILYKSVKTQDKVFQTLSL